MKVILPTQFSNDPAIKKTGQNQSKHLLLFYFFLSPFHVFPVPTPF